MQPKPIVKLSQFRVLRPLYESLQSDGVKWLAAAHALAEKHSSADGFDAAKFESQMEKFISRYGCGPEKIATRGHELRDYLHTNWDEMRIFNLNKNPNGEFIEERSRFFLEASDRAFAHFYKDEQSAPNDIIHVSCTGYMSPSSAQKIVAHKNWQKETTVTHAYHMGCYASIPAVRMASGFLSASVLSEGALTGLKKRIDIVHTELCTLQLNPSMHSPEQLVVQSLFADGFISYQAHLVENSSLPGLNILAMQEEIVPDSTEAMTWECASWGMKMGLSRDVPKLIADALQGFLESLFKQCGLSFKAEKSRALFAVHPGGPKIIEKVQELLGLSDAQIECSRGVLKSCGNMSSATLPHIWERMLSDEGVPWGTKIVSLAFGPGLTICGSILEKAK